MKILLTGATGFIGQHLCQRLVDEGHEVLALVRNPEKAKGLPQNNVSLLKGDLSLFKDKSLVLPPCDQVIHLAGIVTAPSLKVYQKINFDALVDLVECLKRQSWQPKQFLFASSLAAAGPSVPGSPKKESHPCTPIDPYGQAKLAAELYLEEAPFPVVTFRPGAVIGPGDPAMLTIFKLAQRGIGFGVRGHDQAFSWIYVDDLVEAIIAMLKHKFAVSTIYFVNHPRETSTEQLWAVLEKSLGRKIRVIRFPKPLFYMLMLVGTALAKFLPIKNQLDKKQYQQLVAPAWVASSEALQNDLAWEPEHDIHACIDATYQGYKKEKCL
jgi:nucleoside-diphosphate-sugar epimerase